MVMMVSGVAVAAHALTRSVLGARRAAQAAGVAMILGQTPAVLAHSRLQWLDLLWSQRRLGAALGETTVVALLVASLLAFVALQALANTRAEAKGLVEAGVDDDDIATAVMGRLRFMSPILIAAVPIVGILIAL